MALVFIISLMAIVSYHVTAAILEQVSKAYGKDGWKVKRSDLEGKRKMKKMNEEEERLLCEKIEKLKGEDYFKLLSAMHKLSNVSAQTEMNNDIINHPAHYTVGRYETIDGIEHFQLGYHNGNAFKYISRAGKKSKETEIQDLEKALWYIQRDHDYREGDWVDFDMNEYLQDLEMDATLALVLRLISGRPQKYMRGVAADLLRGYIERRKKEQAEAESGQ